jgi:hypothetical protein
MEERAPMGKNKSLALVVSCLNLLFLIAPTYGQKVWDKKPFQQWSDYEAVQIIVDSPWAKTVRDDSSGYATNIRLHSALTLRQALVRQRQVRMNYDKLGVTDKARFDAQVQESLECPDCARYYILTLRIIPTDQKGIRWLSSFSLDDLKSHVFLANETGDRRSLVNFLPPQPGSDSTLFFESAVFYFERLDQGKPLISTGNKRLYFTIDEKVLKGGPVSIGKVTFDVSKLVRNGELVF